MANKMLIDASHPEETRVVVLRGNRVEEFDFEAANKKQLRGNIYLAKVTRVEPSLQAAFVDYGGNRHGFLAFSEIHPDYYQIPVADRQALIDEEARAQRDEEDEEAGQKAQPPVPPGRSRGPRRPGRRRAEKRSAGGETISEAEPAAPDETGERAQDFDERVAPTQSEAANDSRSRMRTRRSTRGKRPRGGLARVRLPRQRRVSSTDEAAGDACSNPPVRTHEAAAAPEFRRRRSPRQPPTKPMGAHGFAVNEPEIDDRPEAAARDGDDRTRRAQTRSRRRAPTTRRARTRTSDREHRRRRDGGNAAPPAALRRQYKIQEVIKRRQVLLVQVVKEERGNKGAALTTYLSLAGRYSVLMPNTARGGGISRKITNSTDRSG